MRRGRGLEIVPGFPKRRARRDLFAVFTLERRFGRFEVDEDRPAVADDLPARDKEMRHMRSCPPGEDEVDRLHGHDRVAIERIEIEHENVGGRADPERSVAGRAVGESSIGYGAGEPLAPLDHAVEAPAAVQEMPEPHLAQNVVVLVEGRGVDADRDPTAALASAIGATPLLRWRFELGLVAITAPDSAMVWSSSSRA